jgi:hypothetical protein
MISVRIEGDGPSYYDALVPALGRTLPDADSASMRTLQAMASALGWSVQDMMRIDNPGGATRIGGARLLLPSSSMAALYADGIGSSKYWTLRWKEDDAQTDLTMKVWLRPERPLFWPDTQGPVLVECVDQRWWWQFMSSDEALASIHTGRLTFDGRYLNKAGTGATGTTPPDALGQVRHVVEALLTSLGLTVSLPVAFNPPAEAMLLLQNLVADWATIAAPLMLDQILSACGYVLQYLPSNATWQVAPIGGDVAIMGSWMNATKRLKCGGVGGTNDPTAAIDILLAEWNGQAEYVVNLSPALNATVIQEGFVEGNAVFDNQTDGGSFGSAYKLPPSIVSDPRPMAEQGTAWLYSAGVLPKQTDNLTGAYPWLTVTGTALATYRQTQYLARASVCFGKSIFGGWLNPPRGSFRQTGCRWTVCDLGPATGFAPVTITEAAWEDWTLGPDGRMNCDPKQLLIPRGNIVQTDLPGGGKVVSVAPPQVRIFKAVILAYTQCDSQWRWKYEWEQVAPAEAFNCEDRWAYSAPMCRKWNDDDATNYAENTLETSNVFGVFIAPNLTVADYAPNTVDCLPIAAGTLVDMCELITTVWPFGNYPNTPAPQYTFQVPNTPLVTCAA